MVSGRGGSHGGDRWSWDVVVGVVMSGGKWSCGVVVGGGSQGGGRWSWFVVVGRKSSRGVSRWVARWW